jgi:diketogulonate reductase-like aldo/keto reductase
MSVKLSITDKLHMPKCATQIPHLGFGVYRSSTSQCIESCTTALKVGYRHIDTAQFYENEAEVGAAVRQSGLKRDHIFITTKILSAGGSFAKSLQKCIDSVDKIDGKEGYVDCFLVHSPNGGKEKRKEMWQALEKLYEIGKAKSIGVSNYGIGHIEEMKAYAKVWPPHVNQIEVSWFPLPHILSVTQATDLHPAAPVVPAKGDCRILPEKQDGR